MITVKDLDGLYKRLVNGMANNRIDKPKTQSFPNLKEEFDCYKECLTKTPFVPRNRIQSFQAFEKEGYMDPETTYTIIWDIDKAIRLAKEMPASPFPMELMKETIRTNPVNLNTYHGGTPNLNNPIIIVFFAPLMAPIIIDGNHRAHYALKKGHSLILSNIFFNGAELDLIADPHSLLMYKIHFNVGKILAYQCGMFNEIKYSETFEVESLFRLA